MSLYKVTTLVQFKHVYFVEGKSLEHAHDEVTMRDSGSDEDFFDEVSQEFLGETIVDGVEVTKQDFNQYLENAKKDERMVSSHWMGEKLIRKIDYAEADEIPNTITITPWGLFEDHQAGNTMDVSHEVFKQMGTSLILGTPDIGSPGTREASRYDRWTRFNRGY